MTSSPSPDLRQVLLQARHLRSFEVVPDSPDLEFILEMTEAQCLALRDLLEHLVVRRPDATTRTVQAKRLNDWLRR